ncbi:hypothetical protein HY946_01830, partial [Candidatus Gottesmanbacteria bacterium]|nr:hypothetical protein [Candidatus Gottesmanbacteria bacterium]
LSSVFRAKVGERLKIASKLSKEREEIKIWLEMQIFFWHKVLLGKGEKFKFLTPKQIVKIIRELEKTKNLVEQNINPRLALEVFLLDLPKVSSYLTPGVK